MLGRRTALLLLAVAALAAPASGLVLGIDFGTSFFKVALVKPGSPFTIVTNTASKRKTETVVAFNSENTRQFAGDAKNLMTRKPLQTYQFARSLLGRNVTHPSTSRLSETFLSHHTLVADGPLHGEVRLLVAVRFGTARLIDNDGGMVPGTPA